MKRRLTIAIDGPSGAGKSSVSRLLAEALGLTYVDTGAMYRAIALKAHESGIDVNDHKKLEILCASTDIVIDNERIFVDGEDLGERIREPYMDQVVSGFSAVKVVRDRLVALQRRYGMDGGVVMEGRDIGTVVFPDADVKFYLDASPEVRAKRRYEQLVSRGVEADYGDILEKIVERDRRDETRLHSPLRVADGAIYIDTSGLEMEEVLATMLNKVRERLAIGNNNC